MALLEVRIMFLKQGLQKLPISELSLFTNEPSPDEDRKGFAPLVNFATPK